MAAGGNFPLRGGGASVAPRLLGGPAFRALFWASAQMGAWLGLRGRGRAWSGRGPGGRGPGGRGRARRSKLSLPAAGGGDRARRRRRRLRREQHGLGHRAVGESDRPGPKFLPFWSPDPLPLCFCKTLAGARRFPPSETPGVPAFRLLSEFSQGVSGRPGRRATLQELTRETEHGVQSEEGRSPGTRPGRPGEVTYFENPGWAGGLSYGPWVPARRPPVRLGRGRGPSGHFQPHVGPRSSDRPFGASNQHLGAWDALGGEGLRGSAPSPISPQALGGAGPRLPLTSALEAPEISPYPSRDL